MLAGAREAAARDGGRNRAAATAAAALDVLSLALDGAVSAPRAAAEALRAAGAEEALLAVVSSRKVPSAARASAGAALSPLRLMFLSRSPT